MPWYRLIPKFCHTQAYTPGWESQHFVCRSHSSTYTPHQEFVFSISRYDATTTEDDDSHNRISSYNGNFTSSCSGCSSSSGAGGGGGADRRLRRAQRTHDGSGCVKYLSAVLFYSLDVLDPRVSLTMDVLSPFISLCYSDWLFHGESCPRLDVVHPWGRSSM